MKASSFVSILTIRTDRAVLTRNFLPWPAVEDLQESETTVQAIPA
jgi:hypothetical protein